MQDSKTPEAEGAEKTTVVPVVEVPSAGGRINLEVDPKSTSISDIEVTWQIPQEPVDGLLVRYGFSKDQIKNASRIYSRDLMRYDDPKHGGVYRFVLGNVPLDRPIFITVAAFSGDRLSKPSDIFEVKAVTPN